MTPSALPAAEWARRQESSRRSVRRANLAVATALGTVLALAFGAVWQGHWAVRSQGEAIVERERAELAQAEARQELWRALLAEARATRQSSTLDRREVGLSILARAAGLGATAELRDQAVATLALPEYRLEASIPLGDTANRYAFDRAVRRAAVVMPDGDVVVRRFPDGAEVARLGREGTSVPGEQGMPMLLEFDPAGEALAVRYARGAFGVWTLGEAGLRFVRDGDRERRQASVPRFTSDGRHLVAPVFAPDGFAVIEADTGRMVAHFPEVSSFRHAAPRPGKTQFAADLGTRVALFDWERGGEVAAHPFPAGARALAWTGDGRRLAIAGNALEVEVWEPGTGEVRRFPGHGDDVYDCAFDPAGRRLATSSLDGTARLWDAVDGRLLAVATDRRLVAWGPGERSGWVVSRERLEVRVGPVGGVLERVAGVPGRSDGLTFDMDGEGQWGWSRDGEGRVWQWDLGRGTGPEPTGLTGVSSLSYDAAGSVLLLTRDGWLEACPWDRIGDGGLPGAMSGTPRRLAGVRSRNVDLVMAGLGGRGRVLVELGAGAVWADSGEDGRDPVEIDDLLHSSVDRRSGSARGTGTVALSPDGRWVACGADGIRGPGVFDVRTGRRVATLGEETGGVQFSADGRWVLLASVRGCQVFETRGWERVWWRPAAVRHPNYSAVGAVSPDGTRVVYGESSRHLVLLEGGSGRTLAALESPAASPWVAARWSDDGRRVIGLTRENAVEIWDLEALGEALAGMGLDWDKPLSGPPVAVFGEVEMPRYPTWVAIGVLATAGMVAGIAMVSLRRHRRLIGDYAVAEDRAARRDRELALEREVGELKSSFVTMVSHEFRTPLGITMSAVELLRHYLDRLSAGKRSELLEDIYGATLRMSGLMEQVLLLGRAESGRLGCRTGPLDLEGLVGQLLDEARSATARRCRCVFETEGDLDGARGDESLLRHILSNLISNAVKYSPPGGEIGVGMRRDGEDAVLSVRDRGIGIPEADQGRLFEAFHRGGNVGQTPGTGLGLLIVKRCVTLHGGGIAVASREGEGTVFTVRLPLFGPGRGERTQGGGGAAGGSDGSRIGFAGETRAA
ncbi:MAG: hypothetical protein KF833_20395 [Verrucomicrobiae bacterium]|nr:hypothetical protein [Verrucomicrobiae bacterium]